jgi:hypothetical protein
MKKPWHRLAALLLWVPLPVLALKYWRVWDRLPLRMAVHFDANWQPNGLTSRQGSLMLAVGIFAAMQILFTITFFIVRAQKPGALWPMLLFSYAFLGFFWFANNWIVEFNLRPQPAHSELVGPNSPAPTNSELKTDLQPHL